jgi:hypothetical protein
LVLCAESFLSYSILDCPWIESLCEKVKIHKMWDALLSTMSKELTWLRRWLGGGCDGITWEGNFHLSIITSDIMICIQSLHKGTQNKSRINIFTSFSHFRLCFLSRENGIPSSFKPYYVFIHLFICVEQGFVVFVLG